MARMKVLDPAGDEWRVWRRWYVWRRWITLRDIWNVNFGPTGDTAQGGSNPFDDIMAIPVLLISLLGLGISLVDLAAQLITLPFALLSRLVRLTAWPVQLDRKDKHVRTLRVKGFARAAALRDEQVAQVAAGRVEAPPLPGPTAEPTAA